jgi:NitT/TauT family transport system substrate-binding protein
VLAVASVGCVSSASRAKGSAQVLRLGIFPNLTHAPGHVAIGSGILKESLAPTTVKLTVFNSGTDAGNALLAGSVDATYIGSGPATALFLKSHGRVAIVSGAVSGGAALVVRKGAGITGPQDLKGKKVAVPGIGNTQDVALRTWLKKYGLKARDAGGEVGVVPVDNPELPQLFRSGQVDAAWEPEPWPTLLVQEGQGQVLVDEASLWPKGQFVTTALLVSKAYLDAHAEVVQRLVEANVKAIQLIQKDPVRAESIATGQLEKAGAPTLPSGVVQQAWKKLTFSWQPLAAQLQKAAEDAYALGDLDQNPSNISEIFQLNTLNSVLRRLSLPAVQVSQ